MRALLTIVLLLGACNGDKCEQLRDKMRGMPNNHNDEVKDLAECREQLRTDPKNERIIDCILAINGTPTTDALTACASVK